MADIDLGDNGGWAEEGGGDPDVGRGGGGEPDPLDGWLLAGGDLGGGDALPGRGEVALGGEHDPERE